MSSHIALKHVRLQSGPKSSLAGIPEQVIAQPRHPKGADAFDLQGSHILTRQETIKPRLMTVGLHGCAWKLQNLDAGLFNACLHCQRKHYDRWA